MSPIGCNCGAKNKARSTYVATFKDGTTRTYNSEIEAKAAVARQGGSYQKKG